jgi:Pup amidohydrolase
VQWEYLHQAVRYAEQGGLEVVGEEVGRQILLEWESVLSDLERDLFTTADRVDWVAKLRLIGGYRERHDLRWNDPRLAALDLQYHDLRPERSLAASDRYQGVFPGGVPWEVRFWDHRR